MSSFKINRATLDNGLRIVHSYDGNTAMAAVNVLYNVGSRDERRTQTGIAHLFEHFMFGGSVNAPSFDAEIERAGGKNNAWTSNDFTNFYDVLPAQNIATAFFLESDRMLSPSFDTRVLEVQKSVVIEEFKQNYLNQPYGDSFDQVRRLSYAPNHPYSWMTIGLSPDHIAGVTLDDAKQWFFSHYAPNNAILSVTGRVEFDQVLELADKYFGSIPRREIPERRLPDPGFVKENVFEKVDRDVPVPFLTVAIPMSSYGTEEYFAADAVTDLLSAGKASRFMQNILFGRGRGLTSGCDGSIIGSEHEGLLLLTAKLNDNSRQAADEVAAMMIDEGLKLREGIPARELERCYNNFEADFRFNNVGFSALAGTLAMAEYHGRDLSQTVARRRALSADTIAEYADKLFQRPSVTILYSQSFDQGDK